MTYRTAKISNYIGQTDEKLKDYLVSVDRDLSNLFKVAAPFYQFGTGTDYSVLTYSSTGYGWFGTVGGWSITNSLLYGGSGSTYIGLQPGVGIWMGDSAFATSVFSVDPTGQMKAHAGEIGGWYIGTTTLSSTNLVFDSSNELIKTSNYVSGALGKGWQIDNNVAEFQNIRARGKITTSVFEKEAISSIGGNFLVSDSDLLNADMTALDASTLTTLGNTTFAVNDILRIKNGLDDEWLLVTAVTSYTKLLSHFDGNDGAVAYTDPIQGAATFAGTAQLDTAQKKFGTASLLLDGNSDYITFPDSADWNFAQGDFTIDCWVRFNSVAASQTILGQYQDANNWWEVYYYKNTETLYIDFATKGSGYDISLNCPFTPSADTWYHIAIVRKGTTSADWLMFIDGDSKTVTKASGDYNCTLTNISAVLQIGYRQWYFNGWIDELRISKGIARWTADFDVPITPHEIEPVYTVTRDQGADYSADNNPAWTKGTAVVNFGASGEGLIFMTASETNNPYIDVVTHAGSPWSALTTRVRLGNLNGFLGYASALYGIAIGETTKYLKYDPTNGLRIAGTVTLDSNSSVSNLAASSVAGWAAGGDTTKIDGGKIYTSSILADSISATAITTSKIAASAITADKLSVSQLDSITVNTGSLTVDEYIQSSNYVATTTGFRLSSSTGLEINEGSIQGTPLISKLMVYAMMFGK